MLLSKKWSTTVTKDVTVAKVNLNKLENVSVQLRQK